MSSTATTRRRWRIRGSCPTTVGATYEDLERQATAARTGYAISQAAKHWFVIDAEDPYTEVKRFDWFRGYHVGGRSLMWGRQSYRWSRLDFEANAREGIAVDWPIRYEDMAPWYDHVERLRRHQRLARGAAAAARRPVPAAHGAQLRREATFRGSRAEKHSSGKRRMIIGRVAHLTAPLGHSAQRGTCQYRNQCIRWLPVRRLLQHAARPRCRRP